MMRFFLPAIRKLARGNATKVKISFIKGRGISASTAVWAKKMPDRPKLVDEEEFTEAFLKGSGPGGQKIVG